MNQPVSIRVSWKADGGIIDDTGLYIAGTDPGNYAVVAEEIFSHRKDTAFVRIHTGCARIDVTPDSVQLKVGQSQQFFAQGYNARGDSVATSILWSANGGSIENNGLYIAADDTGFFRITATDTLSQITGSAIVRIITFTQVTEHEEPFIPTEFSLRQNYPNPFNPETTIEYAVKEQCRVMLKIYDLLGREVLTLVDTETKPGLYRIRFDSSQLPTGVYFYQIQMQEFSDLKKMLILK
ncbi:T9SS type A sorting domain-containing protein [candidate division KSB1 bacterium]|nr:T9SS type A sorting domain-containing protein [candidate division KSB1 bacterium]